MPPVVIAESVVTSKAARKAAEGKLVEQFLTILRRGLREIHKQITRKDMN